MKISINWLNEYVDTGDNIKDYLDAMTDCGTKAEGYEQQGTEITNTRVGLITDIYPAEGSDNLVVCKVDVGDGRLRQIVTGANNVKTGDMVPVTLDGGTLPGGITIKSVVTRGNMSEGMLCSLAELGLTLSDFPYGVEDGILILQEDCSPGDDIKDVLLLKDTIAEFEVTFNRPDCWSYRGIALESGAALKKNVLLKEPIVVDNGDDHIDDYLQIRVENPKLCPRYTARMIKDVKIQPSPLWMRARLRAAGVKPINNIVDITNYVMLEYGQPMHAFDYNFIDGSQIIVRNAFENEKITTLDDIERNLTPDMLCIADGESIKTSKAIALAGVMGGQNSEIQNDTRTVVFESANFDRSNVRATSRALGIRTDSSGLFEKGLPAYNTLQAVNRAIELVVELGCGVVVNGTIDINNAQISPRELPLNPDKINALLGTNLTVNDMAELLKPLMLNIKGSTVEVPPFRGDLLNTADLAEEVARLYGYNNIEESELQGVVRKGGLGSIHSFEKTLENSMAALGFVEALTYSFISPKQYDKIRLTDDDVLRNSIKLLNPLSEDTSVMRTTALPSLLEALAQNYSHRVLSCGLFENATVYSKKGAEILEEKSLVFGFYGFGDFYLAKGYVEGLLEQINLVDAEFFTETQNPSFHSGRTAIIKKDGVDIGVVGQIHPTVAENYDINTPVYTAVLNVSSLYKMKEQAYYYKPISGYPAIERDLALICDFDIEASSVKNAILSYGDESLIDVHAFDIYSGKGVEEGKKSLAFRLLFQKHSRTMTDTEVDALIDIILKGLKEEHNIVLRF